MNNKFVKNWFYLLFSDVSQSIIGFFAFMILAVKLKPEGFGLLNSYLALATLISVIGVNICNSQVITREITLNPKSSFQLFKKFLNLRIASFFLCLLILISYHFFYINLDNKIFLSILFIITATIFWDLSESIAFGHFVTKFTTIILVSFSFIWFLFVFNFPEENISLNLVIWIYALLFLSRAAIYFATSFFKFAKPNINTTTTTVGTIVLMSLPFLWMRGIGSITTQLPFLLLESNSSSEEVGYYSVGTRLVIPVIIAITTAMKAVFPFITKLYKENINDFNTHVKDAFSFILIIGSTISCLLTLTSFIWIELLFGKEYIPSINVFNYEAWSGVLLTFDLFMATVLVSTFRQKILAIITTIDVIIMFPIIYFSSEFGADGLSFAKLLGSITLFLFHVLMVQYYLKIDLKSKQFIYSCFYFIICLCISFFQFSLLIKFSLLTTTLILFLNLKSSPFKLLTNKIALMYKAKY
jgi:O-antigen/teichoic acid export membrane protein